MFAWLRKFLGMDNPQNTLMGGTPDAPSKGGGASTLLATIGGVEVRQRGDVISWTGGLAVDADGSPRAYHPESALGLDDLANAGKPGNWWGLACLASGFPIVQGPNDPAPGFYVSCTALRDPGKFGCDPRAFVDAESIPYLVLPEGFLAAQMGDFALVVNLANGRKCPAICADRGPAHHIGEGSIALAAALGVPASPRKGGCEGGILAIVFAGSRTVPRWPHTVAEINATVASLVSSHHLNLPNLPTA